MGSVFAYLIVSDPLTLIDTGVGYQPAREALLQGLKAHGVMPSDIRRILITHSHMDHVGNAGWLQEASGAEVWVHPDEGAKLGGISQYIDQWKHHLTLAGMPEEEQARVAYIYEQGQRLITVPEWKPLAEGQRLPFADGTCLEAITLPGHALGHTGFLMGDELFGGDHLLQGVTPNPIMEPVPPDHPDSVPHAPGRALTLGQFLSSLTRVSALELKRVWPGHGAVIDDHRKVAATYAATHERRLDSIQERLDEGKTAWELSRELYPRVRDVNLFLALSEVLAHLDLLVVRGRAVLDGNLFRAVRS